MTDISIIVPIYNSERWLEKCIESVLNQTWNSLELVLVNDGSTDASEELCQFYADQDERIVFFSQSNQGQGSARNSGFDAASGDYIYFLDSDDHIAEEMVERCMGVIRKERYDILTFDTKCMTPCEDAGRYSRTLPFNELLQGRELLRLNIENGEYCPTVWLYMYKRSYLSSNKIRFSEGILYEDNAFTYRVLTRQATCFYLPFKLHFRLTHDDSIIGKKPTSDNIESMITILKEMIDIHSELGNPRAHLKLLRMYAWLPLRISLEGSIFDRDLFAKYIWILIKNPNLFSTSILKSIVKFIIRLGSPINTRL